MKQGIFFGIIISLLSFMIIIVVANNNISKNLELVIIKDGEELYTSSSFDNDIIWLITENHENNLVLKNEEILAYYNFNTNLESLLDLTTIDFEQIENISGEDVEVNMIFYQDNELVVYEANCPDKLCIKTGSISKANQLIVCAPHKLVIKLVGVGDVDA